LAITDEGRAMCLRHQNIGSRCITVLFAGFSEAELSAQIKGYQQIFGNLESFSSAILELARENAEQANLANQKRKIDQAHRKNKFLSY
jgi:hypothetical protein